MNHSGIIFVHPVQTAEDLRGKSPCYFVSFIGSSPETSLILGANTRNKVPKFEGRGEFVRNSGRDLSSELSGYVSFPFPFLI